jgi:hypothetical protein
MNVSCGGVIGELTYTKYEIPLNKHGLRIPFPGHAMQIQLE